MNEFIFKNRIIFEHNTSMRYAMRAVSKLRTTSGALYGYNMMSILYNMCHGIEGLNYKYMDDRTLSMSVPHFVPRSDYFGSPCLNIS